MKKLYKSKSCGTIVGKVFDDGGVLACCGEDMEELVPKTADSATEKHVPVVYENYFRASKSFCFSARSNKLSPKSSLRSQLAQTLIKTQKTQS